MQKSVITNYFVHHYLLSRVGWRRRGNTKVEEKGEYKKGGADPSVSDVAPPPRSGGNLLSHPSGQYHRRWRA